jgi:hypothetical protein
VEDQAGAFLFSFFLALACVTAAAFLFSLTRPPSSFLTKPQTPQLIKGLEAARGNGTSMISLIMPPKDQVRYTFAAVCASRRRSARARGRSPIA